MPNSKIQLTRSMEITSGSHIAYFYHDVHSYLENMASFITIGIENSQHILIIDSLSNIKKMTKKIKTRLTEDDMNRILFIDHTLFYETNHNYQCSHILHNFSSIIAPYVENQLPTRAWANVAWKEQTDIHIELEEFECTCDAKTKELGILILCSYNAIKTSAAIMIAALKTHEYIMTDTKLAKSDFYTNTGEASKLSPSLSSQSKIDNEMDLYKQKLDFVQAVSHEVRNPLTVIKAYATMVAKEEISAESRSKLNDIRDYVDVIDNEIAHIINTEQMLTTESLWVKSILTPLTVLEEICRIFEIKARTQNIKLHNQIYLTGQELMNSNLIGFRLILSNLLSNAIKYSYEAGNVYLNASVLENSLVISIKDEGIGMTGDQLNKLFLKYEKTNNDQSGQGIGLFMVKKLMNHFEGNIQFLSSINQGTQVQVFLPLV